MSASNSSLRFSSQKWIFLVVGVEEFIEWVKEKFPKQKIPCPCTQCLNQVYTTWQEVKDHLLMNTMSPTYTTWIHHGEEGGGTDIIEPSDVHGSHHDGWIAEEEQEDGDDNILLDFDDLVKNLLTSEQWAGRVPKFRRVLDDLKQSVSSRSTFPKLSFHVKALVWFW